MKTLTKEQKREIAAIAAKKDEDIDLSDMPEVIDWSDAHKVDRGKVIEKIRFTQIEDRCEAKPGVYEIHTNAGTPLKVGMGRDLLSRLRQHRASRQSCLRLKQGGLRCNPNDVQSKGSILAKHLYYDASIALNYNLTSENGRQRFLEEECYIVFELTENEAEARRREKLRERTGQFRYVGRVLKR